MGSWSGLRKHLKSLIVPELRDSFDLHYTVYDRPTVEGLPPARFWMTVGKQEVYTVARTLRVPPEEPPDELEHVLEDLTHYLSMSIQTAHSSPSVVVRALAMLDRRTGIRTLRTLKSRGFEHPLLEQMHDLRVRSRLVEE
jgi:hypothetical protein